MCRASEASERAALGPFAQGGVLDGRYRLEAIIGRGRTSLVYRARDLARGARMPLAIKLLRPALHDGEVERRALLAEGERLCRLAHPAIVAIHDVRATPVPFLVLEALEDGSLASVLRTRHPIAPARAASLLEGIAAALAFLHAKGFVHADIKPANLLCSEGGTKLIDFGSARRIGEAGPRLRERILTPAYAAPEMLRGARPEPRDDVFGLAIVAYELITGSHPFCHRPALPTDCVPAPQLPEAGWNSLKAALSPRRAERPDDPRAVIAALRAGHPVRRLLRKLASCPA